MKRRPIPPATLLRLARRDLVRSALHEAAHVVVALDCGGTATAAVFRSGNPASIDPFTEKFWVGRCWFRGVSDADLPLISLAGAVADLVFESEGHPVDELDLLGAWESGEHGSDSDRDLAGCVSAATAKAAVTRVDGLWPEIRREAARMIRATRAMERQDAPGLFGSDARRGEAA